MYHEEPMFDFEMLDDEPEDSDYGLFLVTFGKPFS